MKDITDFQRAVAAIDSGNTTELLALISENPGLVTDRFSGAGEGYFKEPYLLWFVADNPVRVEKLPPNMVEITRLLVDAVKQAAPETYQYQVDYTLVLVASGRVVRECGVQVDMLDLLLDAGATRGGAMAALTNGNVEAARHLVDRGDKLTLAIAVCLERPDDINRLLEIANDDEKLTALTAAAFYGKADRVKHLLEMNTDPNGFPAAGSGFHCHATPLHQAVSSGSLDCVQLLVEAGASLDATDKVYNGTPWGWAAYMQADDASGETARTNFGRIKNFLGTK